MGAYALPPLSPMYAAATTLPHITAGIGNKHIIRISKLEFTKRLSKNEMKTKGLEIPTAMKDLTWNLFQKIRKSHSALKKKIKSPTKIEISYDLRNEITYYFIKLKAYKLLSN